MNKMENKEKDKEQKKTEKPEETPSEVENLEKVKQRLNQLEEKLESKSKQLEEEVKPKLKKLEKEVKPSINLPVAEIESVVSTGEKVKLRVRLKGQRPENKCLLEFEANPDIIETIHEAKKRDGTVWVRFNVVYQRHLIESELVVRDVLE